MIHITGNDPDLTGPAYTFTAAVLGVHARVDQGIQQRSPCSHLHGPAGPAQFDGIADFRRPGGCQRRGSKALQVYMRQPQFPATVFIRIQKGQGPTGIEVRAFGMLLISTQN